MLDRWTAAMELNTLALPDRSEEMVETGIIYPSVRRGAGAP